MSQIPTVTIKTENGPVVINESDLTDEHTLYKPGKTEKPEANEAEKPRGSKKKDAQ